MVFGVNLFSVLLFMLFASPAGPLAAETAEEFLPVSGPCNLEFPKDHGMHPGRRTEWWYYTGNLRSGAGARFGFQLTFFRSQISPPGAKAKWPDPPSRWRTQQIFFAHAALTDIGEKRHVMAERIGRGVLGIAGVSQTDFETVIFVRDWSTRIAPGSHQLSADTGAFALDLALKPSKVPALHGRSGYSRKGSNPENASCYYSFTRLEATGALSRNNASVAVAGSAWMDHEFSTAPLEPGIVGWDWFGLQLADRTEVMIYLLRKKNGEIHPESSGTLVHADGRTDHLKKDDFRVSVLDAWKSPRSGARYPARWRLWVAPFSMDVTVTPALADQEMDASSSAGVTYWEGSVTVKGARAGRPVDGHGYVELTGYAKPFEAPL